MCIHTYVCLLLQKWKFRASAIAELGAAASLAAQLYNTRAINALSYIAQFRPLPAEALSVERRLVNKMLRVPGNTFGAQQFLNVRFLNGPRFTSAMSLAGACAIRTATSTVTVWSCALTRLMDAAVETLPLSSVIRGHLSQPFWDEPPICLFLYCASRFSCRLPPPPPSPSEHSPPLLFPALIPSLHRPPFPCSPLKIPFSTPHLAPSCPQRHAYNVLLNAWQPDRWKCFFTSCLTGAHAIGYETVASVDFDAIFSFLQRLPHHVVMSWVKTVANGWTTSSRLHLQHGNPCICCHRSEGDHLQHYLMCSSFASIVCEVCTASPSLQPLVALALHPIDHITMKTLFVKYTTYHSCRNTYHIYCPASPQRWRTVLLNTARAAAAKYELLTGSS